MRKLILLFLLLTTSVFAQSLTAINITEGEYVGYKALKGYENENLYQVYFQGSQDSYQVTFETHKKIDMNEVITWKFNDKVIKSPRKELYKFFSDTSYFSSRKVITDEGQLTPIWFQETFGQVYQDWVDDFEYATEAQRLVEKYFKQINSTNNRFKFSE